MVILNTLSDRLKFALKKSEMSQVELANKIGVRPQVINYLYQCDPKTSKYTYLIADALAVNPIWLATGSGTDKPENTNVLSHADKVPIISYKQAKDVISNIYKIDEIDANQWISTNLDIGLGGFAIKLKDKSMYPRFDEGALLLFDSNSEILDGSITLVYNKITDDIMIRQVIFKNEKIFLVAINQDYKTLEFSNDHITFGHLKEVRLYEKEHF